MVKKMKRAAVALVAIAVFGNVAYAGPARATSSNGDNSDIPAATKTVRKTEQMTDVPSNYRYMDFEKMAQEFDELVFSFAANPDYVPVDTESYLPIGYWDDNNVNGYGRTFGFPSYIGHINEAGEGTLVPGSQEAIATMAPVLSGMLVGIDKTEQHGYNLVEMMNEFHNVANGEDMVLNHVDTSTGQSFWYELYPQLLYIQLYETAKRQYGQDIDSMREIIVEGADNWLEALPNFKDRDGRLSFDFTSYDMKRGVPVRNGRWTEPPGGALAYIFYSAHETTGEQKYLDAMALVMDELDDSAINPYYEVTQDYSALMAAMMNFRFGEQYDVDKMINWIFDADSDVRTGWGVMAGEWGGYQADGLVGSDRDSGGFGFLMNTYHLGAVLAPLAKYDPRYSDAIGKWYLGASNSVRLMYPNELPAANQIHGGAFEHDPEGVLGYEGVRHTVDDQTPYASGDPVRYGWGQTDYGIYGSALVGVFGAVIEPTEVERILQLDLNATDYFREEGSFPHYLYYNPYPEERSVAIELDDSSKLFDAAAKKTLATNVSGTYHVTIPAMSSLNVIVLPAEADIRHEGNSWMVGARTIAKDAIGVSILSPSQQRTYIESDEVELELALTGSNSAHMTVSADGEVLYDGDFSPSYALDTTQLPNGIVNIAVTVESEGLVDKASLKLSISNPDADNIIYEASVTDLLQYEPVEVMPAAVTDSGDGYARITEDNDEGDWGAVQTGTIEVDFDRRPYLEIETVDPDPYYTIQLKFEDEEWGNYVLSNGMEDGKRLIDLRGALATYGDQTQRTGPVPLRVYLMANGKEGASFGMKSLRLFYNDSSAAATSVTFKAEDMADFVPGEAPATSELIGKKAIMENRTDNEGYGGVLSEAFTLDWSRNPTLHIDIAEVGEENTYTLKLLFGDSSYYVYPNRTDTGLQTINLAEGIEQQHSESLSGSGEAQLELWATDAKGAYFIVDSLEIIYEDEGTAYAADQATIETFASSSSPGRIGYVNAVVRVTENHPDADYGAVRSAPFLLDFDKPIELEMDVVAVTEGGALQLEFEGDEQPMDVVVDATEAGLIKLDVASALRDLNPTFDKSGTQRVMLHIMAKGAEGASVDVRSIRLRHMEPAGYGLELDKRLVELTTGESVQVSSQLDGGEGAISWSSSDERVARVDGNGLVTAVGTGSALIMAERDDRPGLGATLTLAVRSKRAEAVTVATPADQPVGGKVTLQPAVAPADALNYKWIFRSSNPSVAEVTPSGVVSIVAAGTAQIRIATEDGYARNEITVRGYLPQGGGGTGGGGHVGVIPPDDEDVEDTPNVGEWQDGVYVLQLRPEEVIRAAEAAADQGGAARIELAVSEEEWQTAAGFTVEIPGEVWSDSVWSDGEVAYLLLTSPLGEIRLRVDEVRKLYGETEGPLALTLRTVLPEELSERIEQAANGRTVYSFAATIDGRDVTEDVKGLRLALVTLPSEGGESIVKELSAAGEERANPWSGRTAAGVSFVAGGSVYVVLDQAENPYVDMGSHWATESASLAAARGMMQGTGEGRFAPGQGMSRAMVVQMLANLEHVADRPEGGALFVDVQEDAWYASAISWADRAGIVRGVGNGKFEPNRMVTREEVAVILLRYAQSTGLPLPNVVNDAALSFTDSADIQPWAIEAVRSLHAAGIIRGMADNTFAPGEGLLRAQAATLMKEWISYSLRVWDN